MSVLRLSYQNQQRQLKHQLSDTRLLFFKSLSSSSYSSSSSSSPSSLYNHYCKWIACIPHSGLSKHQNIRENQNCCRKCARSKGPKIKSESRQQKWALDKGAREPAPSPPAMGLRSYKRPNEGRGTAL